MRPIDRTSSVFRTGAWSVPPGEEPYDRARYVEVPRSWACMPSGDRKWRAYAREPARTSSTRNSEVADTMKPISHWRPSSALMNLLGQRAWEYAAPTISHMRPCKKLSSSPPVADVAEVS